MHSGNRIYAPCVECDAFSPAVAAMFCMTISSSLCILWLQATQDSNVRGGKHARSASHPGDMQQALLGDTDDYPRSASHAYASTRTGAFSPSADFVGRSPSTRVRMAALHLSVNRDLHARSASHAHHCNQTSGWTRLLLVSSKCACAAIRDQT